MEPRKACISTKKERKKIKRVLSPCISTQNEIKGKHLHRRTHRDTIICRQNPSPSSIRLKNTSKAGKSRSQSTPKQNLIGPIRNLAHEIKRRNLEQREVEGRGDSRIERPSAAISRGGGRHIPWTSGAGGGRQSGVGLESTRFEGSCSTTNADPPTGSSGNGIFAQRIVDVSWEACRKQTTTSFQTDGYMRVWICSKMHDVISQVTCQGPKMKILYHQGLIPLPKIVHHIYFLFLIR